MVEESACEKPPFSPMLNQVWSTAQKKKTKKKKKNVEEFAYARGRSHSGNVPISRRLFSHTLKVLAIDQAFNPSFDHVDVGDETSGKLREDFVHEMRVDEFLALSMNQLA